MNLTPENTAALSRLARQVSRTVARHRPWLDPSDLEQEAWAAMLAKIDAYDAVSGSLVAFLYPVALIAAKRLAIRLGAVASVPRRVGSTGEVARQRASSIDETEAAGLSDLAPTPDEALASKEEGALLAAVVAEYLAAGREGDAIRAVLTGELKSKEAAARHAVQVAWLYQATHATKRAIRADKRLSELR